MRSSSITLLSGLLGLQIVLAGWLLFRGQQHDVWKPTKLVTAAEAEITRVVITDNDKISLELKKQDSGWALPTLFDIAVSPEKLQATLHKIFALETSWPAGKTMIAAKQFEVVEEKFERKVEMFKGDELVSTLFFGASPSYKKAYVRANKSDDTFTVDFTPYDLSTKANDWVHRGLAHVDRAQVKSLAAPHVQLQDHEGTLQLASIPEGKVMDTAELTLMLASALTPNVNEVIGKKGAQEPALGSPYLQYTVALKDGSEKLFQYYMLPGESLTAPAPLVDKANKAKGKAQKAEVASPAKPQHLILTVTGSDYFFKVDAGRLHDLMTMTPDKLMKVKGQDQAREGVNTQQPGTGPLAVGDGLMPFGEMEGDEEEAGE